MDEEACHLEGAGQPLNIHEDGTIPEICNLLLDSLKVLQNEGKSRSDVEVKEYEEKLRQALTIPDVIWKNVCKGLSPVGLIDSFSGQLNEMIENTFGKNELLPNELLQQASDGLALKGILVTNEPKECANVRETVIEVPSVVLLNCPMSSQSYHGLELTSQIIAEDFHKSFSTLGHSIIMSRGDLFSFQTEAGLLPCTSHKMDSETAGGESYLSKVRYSYIPTASCELEKKDLMLCKEAKKDLKVLEQQIEETGDETVIQTLCEDFLRTYGSHVNLGVQFGGMYTWQATYCSKVSCAEEYVHKILNDALDSLTTMSFSGLGITYGGSISGDQIKADANVAISHSDAELSKLTLNVIPVGGLQQVQCLPLWRIGLLTSNTTWAVIDRGSSFDKDFVGIWELIQNSPTEFSDSRELAIALQQAWRFMNSRLTDPSQTDAKVKEITVCLNDFIETHVQEWSTDEELSVNAVTYIQKLMDYVEHHCSDTRNLELWVRKLNTDKELYSFLKHVMRIKEEYSQTDLAFIYCQLNRILRVAQGQDFPLKNEIARFIDGEDEEYIPDVVKRHSIRSITSLISAIKLTLLPDVETAHAKANSVEKDDSMGDADKIDIQATRDMEFAMEHLQIQLERGRKLYELFLLRVALYEMGYDAYLKCFKIIFTEQSLSGFVQKLEALWEEYLTYQQCGLLEMQSYLIELLIEALPESSKSREQEFEFFLSGIRRLLTSEMAVTLARFISSTPYYWNGLLAVLDELKKGNKSVLKNKAVDIAAFDSIWKSEAQRNQNFYDETTPIPDESTHAGKLLVQLALTCHYPSKICLQDVMSIGSRCGNEDSSSLSLPWRILQKLIMLDYNARDNETRKTTFEDEEKLKETPDEKRDVEFTFESLLGDFASEGVEEMSLNPLDVFLTIYSCCDMMLKQTLVQKMVQCRLAVPFISPSLSGGSLLYSLWALRSIIVEWKNKDQVCMETSVVCQPVKTVSFIRIGRPSCSKSILLNNVLSDQAHHTFWNRECPLGNTDRSLANGLVEAQWYIPAGKATDKFEDVTMFFNLRGDGFDHNMQLEFLQKNSNVIVCCLETSELGNPEVLDTMKTIHSNSSMVVLLLVQKDPHLVDQKVLRKFSQEYVTYIGKTNMVNTRTISGIKGNKARTTEDLKQELRNVIQKCLSGMIGTSIEESSTVAKKTGIDIDEDDQVCLKAKELAKEVILSMGNKSTNDCKREMLLLQGENWQEWSRLLKDKQHSVTKGVIVDTIHERAHLQATMTQIRQKQLKICDSFSDLMKVFLTNLLQVIDSSAVVPYLQWLKIFLDEKSRNTLPGLHRTYHKKWLEFSASMDDPVFAAKLKTELHAAETMVAEASLGVEHLFREIAQMYEAALESKLELARSTREVMDQLPTVAAKMLLKGQPIEIMDGDVANVPLTWVKAVFSSLTELVGEKKLFVISVLGIQSSGKSTLLNTMFGLQFAVSAGRCTRGVYMQLIKVDKERSDLPYDYVLVVDTEGLRAPELGQLKHVNDNQLATFVIGLGDVTILNIKGENVAEVSDVLQIAVHAFLRMKLVNKNFQLHRTCVFIHQNVPAVNAKEKMQHGCQKLKERLDEMTREASDIEDIVDIHTFNEVIKFDGETNVWYFSDLWHGDPPMAPANPGYSEKVQEVKESLLKDLSQKQETFLTFSDMKHRIEDLWRGVLSENFVFSFRNSLAAKAYHSLESIYHEKSWNIENSINKWITQEATVQLERCTTKEELEGCCLELRNELHRIGNALRDSAHSDLEHFFETHNLKDIVIEWKTAKTETLNSDATLCILRAEKEIGQRKDNLRVDLVQKSRLAELNSEIMMKAKILAEEMEGQKAGERDLHDRFEKFWVERENEYTNGTTALLEPIEWTVQRLLYNRLEKESTAVRRELQKYPLLRQPEYSTLEGSIIGRDIEQSHISVQKTWMQKARSVVTLRKSQPSWYQHKQAAADVCNNILKNVDIYLNDISTHDSGFQELDARNVIKKVVDGVNEHNQKTQQTGFTLRPNLTVKIAVHACRYAVAVFKEMQDQYQENHAIKRKFEAFKNAAWSMFKNTVNQCTSEMIAADLLSNHLEVLLKQAVRNRMSGEIVNHVVRYFNHTKFHLIVRILTDLMEGRFSAYQSFICNPKDFSLEWITTFTNKEMFLPIADTSRYVTYAEQHIAKLVESTKKSIRATTEILSTQEYKGTGLKMWVTVFRDKLRELPVKDEDLQSMIEQNVDNFENLEELLTERLEQLAGHTLGLFKSETHQHMKWVGTTPYKQILDKLWGCEACCPFCGEICQRTDPNHLSPQDCHLCIQHRPDAVHGACWESKDERDGHLVLETCNFHVQSGHGFKRNNEWHPYKAYKTHEPDWDIAPSPNMESSKYWMWFVATYKQPLAHWHNAKVPKVPKAWNKITKKEALDSLRTYNN